MNTEKQNGAGQSAASNPVSQKDTIDINTAQKEKQYRITCAHNTRETIWGDVRSYSLDELCSVMTDHKEGAKDGKCFTPAVFRGTRRKKMDAQQIDLLVLDCDTGETEEQIISALKKNELYGVIYSTHSHMTDKEKPCPKFRVVLPLENSWIADDFESQEQANGAWAKAIFDIADKLGLQHDQSCKDTSRAYYFPRHANGNECVTEIIEGNLCVIDWAKYKQNRCAPKQKRSGGLSPYLQAALDDELRILNAAPKGDRNNQLNKAAHALAQLISHGLAQDIIVKELGAIARNIGLDNNEAEKTILSGISAGIKSPRKSPKQYANQNKNVKDFDGHFDQVIPFDQYETPLIPSDLLPPALGNYAKNMSDIFYVPEAMPVMTALGVVSCAVGKKFIISPKEDWNEPINTYTIVALPPGSVKSLVTNRAVAPIELWEESEAKRIKPERERKQGELEILELDLKRAEQIIKSKASEPKEREEAKQDLLRLRKEVEEKKSEIPPIPKAYANNVTPEALEQFLYEQDNRFAIISDEGGVIETLSGLYSSGNANIDIVLKGIDGGSVRIKRKDREYSLNPYLSLLLVVQPQILINISDKRTFIGNGFLERFFYVLPVENIGYRKTTEEVLDTFYEEQYSNLIFNLLSIETPDKPYKITLTHPAKSLWNEFREDIEKEMRPDGQLYICRGWGAKLAGYTLRLAGLLHVAQHANASNLVIEEGAMKNAIKLAHLLREHTVAAYGLMALDQDTQDAKELFEWLKTRHVKMLTKSDISHELRNRKMGKKDRLDKAIEVLTARNILSDPHEDSSTRKPTTCYFINPDIY